MGPRRAPRAPALISSACLGQLLRHFNNIWLPGAYLALISNRIRKNMPAGFRLGSGEARIQA